MKHFKASFVQKIDKCNFLIFRKIQIGFICIALISDVVIWCYNCYNKSKVSVSKDYSLDSTETQHESTECQPGPTEWVVMETPVPHEAIDNLAVAQNEILADHNSDDITTFEAAIQMEIATMENPENNIRRRVSSRLSLKSDELPDYENYESYPVYNP